MSFSDFKSITIWPKEDESRPLVFLVYGVIWFLVLSGLCWMAVGLETTTHLVNGGTVVQMCGSDAPCSDTNAGNFLKSTVGFDEWADGAIVGIVAIGTYLSHLENKRAKERRLNEFNSHYSALKTDMVKATILAITTSKDIKGHLANSGISTPDEIDNFTVQVTSYLLGEMDDLTIGTNELAEKVYMLPSVRPLAAAIISWKLDNLNELHGHKWPRSKERDRVMKLHNDDIQNIRKNEDYRKYLRNFNNAEIW